MQTSGKAAIINSRQNKYPIGSDEWVCATVAAVQHLREKDLTLLTSLGMNTWELTLALAARLDLPVLIIAPRPIRVYPFMADIRKRFNLKPDLSDFIFIGESQSRPGKKWWAERDNYILDKADFLFPVSVRPGGRMESGLNNRADKIRPEFKLDYKKIIRPRPRYDDLYLNPEIITGDWLIHFTRTSPGPWPGETEFDYYQAMVNSAEEYCHSAINTLNQILDESKIRAGTRNMRGGHKAVAFTAGLKENPGIFFRYRPRLVNAYFEPYGIAIERKAAESAGIKPVIYGEPDDYNSLTESEKPYFQNIGRMGIWRGEEEWRHIGDFDLGCLPPEAIRVIIYRDSERKAVASRSPFEIIPFSEASC